MGTRKPSKKALLSQYLAQARLERITEADWRKILTELAPVSESYLRGLVRMSGIPLDSVVEGIRQDSFGELERTLLAMSREYAEAKRAGDRDRARRCRRMVIIAKEHARLALRRLRASPEAAARKEEMISWMLIWLEDPEIFPAWLRLRKKAAALADD